MRGLFPVNLYAAGLPFWWKRASFQVIFKDFTYFIIYAVNGYFGGTGPSSCFTILKTFFIFI